jgi:thioredoxin-like negative regulator of GroEL
VRFCKVNVDTAPTLNARYGITAIPTFITFQAGQMKQKLVGTRAKSQLAAVLAPLL